MLITCPDCVSQYEVELEALGPEGRMVRCAECGAKWRVMPKNEEDGEPEEVEPVAAFDWDDAEYEEEGEDEDDEEDVPEPVAAALSPPPPKKKPRRRLPTIRFGKPRMATAAAVVGLALAIALVAGRDKAASVFPDLASLYELAGIPVNLRGLDFHDVETSETIESGVPVLVVTGSIENVSNKTVEVPRVRLAVRATNGREIYVWTAMPSKPQLAAGDVLPFTAQLASPPAGGRDVSVRFLNARDAQFNASAQVTQ